ncbi:SGNH/GDSL hydrolase family protein [Microbacterium sp. CnD16-F]|uniref:SGNH/GDSL hydrolase family protein n=1 Tax=Microbacterium sp. CnD16-F TaxID=2954493 RepID=UPI0020968B72|nr:SGNH/GDSL hydrolase family protein [Microbacterium sp. CnD16-F]MCO7202132.1 SGNH/GDSL hydrolase family protein [Microbacterium sp. CnD16-F]
MARLPKVGGDQGNWGDILNDYLSQSHNDDGSLKNDTVGAPQLKSQSVTNAAIADGAIAEAKLSSAVQTKLNAETTIADGSITTSKLADDSVTNAKLAGAGAADGVATLDANAKLPETQVPERLSEAALNDTLAEAIEPIEEAIAEVPATYVARTAPGADTLSPAFTAAMMPWYAALARREFEKCNAVFVGTSITEGGPVQSGGLGVTARANRWVDRLAQLLRARNPLLSPPVGSKGYIPAFYQTFNGGGVQENGRITPTGVTYGGAPLVAAGAGLGNRTLELDSSGDFIQFTFDGTGCDLYYNSRSVASSTATYQVDGGADQTLPVPAATGTGAMLPIRGLAAGSHTIRVTWGSGQVDVDGIYPYNGDESKGIHLYEAGKGSAKASDVMGTGPYRALTHIQPALIGIEFGYNEFFAPVALPTFKTNLQTVVTNARANVTKPPTVLFLKWAEPFDATPAPDSYDAYMAVVDEVAAATPNAVVVDFRTRYPANTPNTLGLWHGDKVHDSDYGAQYKADVLARFLTPQ